MKMDFWACNDLKRRKERKEKEGREKGEKKGRVDTQNLI
jgi:hypothetical protein